MIKGYSDEAMTTLQNNQVIKDIKNEGQKIKSTVGSGITNVLGEIEGIKNTAGDSLTKLFKDLNLTKDNAVFAPPIIQKESKVINMGKGGSSITMDSSVPVRIDDLTLKKIQSNNLRVV
jgi:hypothetical protein